MKVIIAILLLFFSLSCVQEVDLNIQDGASRPVMNCIFNPDSSFSVFLTESNSEECLDDAEVKLYKDDSLLEILEYSNNSFSGETSPQLSHAYTLEVETKQYGTVKSTDRLPNKAIKIESIVQTDSSGFTIQNNDPYATIEISFKDEPIVNNYYELSIIRKIDTVDIEIITDPVFFLIFPSEEDFKIDLQHEQLMLFSQDESIVTEGLDRQVDLFVGYSSLFINDRLFDGEEKSLSIQYIPYYHMNSYCKVDKRKFIVQLRSISENYYLYRKSEVVNKKYKRQEALWKDADSYGQIFSNVENGFGLFAAYVASFDSIIVSNGK